MESAAAVQAAAVSSTNFLVVINFGMPVSLCMGRRSGGRISETWRAGVGQEEESDDHHVHHNHHQRGAAPRLHALSRVKGGGK